MGKGVVFVINELIASGLGFPPGWTIEQIVPSTTTFGVSQVLIDGPDFPSVNNMGDAERVDLIVHEKSRTFEVKKCP